MWLDMFSMRKASLAPISARVHSLEGDIYLLELELNQGSQFVVNADAHVKKFVSFTEAKQYAQKLGVDTISIALTTPYDQMIGLNSSIQ